MLTVVVAHHSRQARALTLAATLNAHLIVDTRDSGALATHLRALTWAHSQGQRVVVIEDDALPVPGFDTLMDSWCQRFPGHLISGYLGTGRPPWLQTVIRREIERADRDGHDYITLPHLAHGVCYTVPPDDVPVILTRFNPTLPADYAVGTAWTRHTGLPIIYPTSSLTDHADIPSVEHHPDRQPRDTPRHAWRLATPPTPQTPPGTS